MSFRVTDARDFLPCFKKAKCKGFEAFLIITRILPYYIPIYYTTTTTTRPSLYSSALRSTTLHCTQLDSITLHYNTLYYTTLPSTTLNYTPLYNYIPTSPIGFLFLKFPPLPYTVLLINLKFIIEIIF